MGGDHVGISSLHKTSLGFFPTPFEELKRLSQEIGGPRIWVKRDDLTGLGMGGSKTRSLEHLIGDAVIKGADTIITCGPVTSNHVRLTAAAARKLGLSCTLVLRKDEKMTQIQGNLLLNRIFGAKMIFSDCTSLAELEPIMEETALQLILQGKKPYIIPGGGYSPIGASGYVKLVEELLSEAEVNKMKIDAVIFASGSGCLQSGLIVGKSILNADMKIIGITINRDKESLTERIYSDVKKTFKLLEMEMEIAKDEIVVLDDYIGPGYAIPSIDGMEAIYHLAELEGLILDPCYTGKTMAAVIDLAKREFKEGQNIVFIHTGGSPGVFSYNEVLSKYDPFIG